MCVRIHMCECGGKEKNSLQEVEHIFKEKFNRTFIAEWFGVCQIFLE